MIRNPVLRGFNPDPAILRVEDDFYIATSTFEWFPGVRIHHSRDLVNWRPLTHALTRQSQLDLVGVPRSGGIWAPCLSHSEGKFYLVYTITKNWGPGFADTPNYLVTAESIEGPWSEPIYLNASGFDPSLFHDDDGRKWLVNVLWDFRPGRNPFQGILLQEFDDELKKLVGPIRNICAGSSLGATEGPHLYKRGGMYHLLLAEGGTSYDHAVTLARSSSIFGPYEIDPRAPLLTSKDTDAVLQKAGHASLVETRNGRWYVAHLCGRPVRDQRCPLGRETALQEVYWTNDGWLRLAAGGSAPFEVVPSPGLPLHPFPPEPVRDSFEGEHLGACYSTLRTPASEDWLSLKKRPGFLRLRGRQSPGSLHQQSLVARRLESTEARFETMLEFEPESFQELAGLICFYDDENFFYLCVTHDETVGKCLQLYSADKGKLQGHLEPPVPLPFGVIALRAEYQSDTAAFSWSSDAGTTFERVGPTFDATKLSDEYNTRGLGFTGTLVGLCAHDMSGRKKAADFHYFDASQG